jgi:FMN phosphatase YigB (HAD superfamily)
MLRGVLFDLDGTLLDLSVDAFLRRYFAALDDAISPVFPDVDLMPAVLGSTAVMQRPHPGATNREVFFIDFKERTGIDLDERWSIFDAFYRNVFPTLGFGYGPADGARRAVEAAQSIGLKTAVATQPIFPRIAIDHRLQWAGLADIRFDAVTSYEDMRACKPQSEYFLQTAAMIGCEPQDCLMVGDDRDMDMAAAAVGMGTYYVGDQRKTKSDFRGTIRELPAFLKYLAQP